MSRGPRLSPWCFHIRIGIGIGCNFLAFVNSLSTGTNFSRQLLPNIAELYAFSIAICLPIVLMHRKFQCQHLEFSAGDLKVSFLFFENSVVVTSCNWFKISTLLWKFKLFTCAWGQLLSCCFCFFGLSSIPTL